MVPEAALVAPREEEARQVTRDSISFFFLFERKGVKSSHFFASHDDDDDDVGRRELAFNRLALALSLSCTFSFPLRCDQWDFSLASAGAGERHEREENRREEKRREQEAGFCLTAKR